MSRNTMGEKLGRRVSISVLMLLSMPAIASASIISDVTTPLVGAFTRYPMLSDSSLSRIRGKYVDGANVVYFGLQLVTQWEDSQGHWINIGSNMGINLNQRNDWFHIRNWSNSGGGEVGSNSLPDNNYSIQGKALRASGGVLQSIQVAGDLNKVTNWAKILVGPKGSFMHTTAALPPSTIEPVLQVCNQAGTEIGSVNVGTNGVSLSLNLPGGNHVSQHLGIGGISQEARVVSNANHVFNHLIMQVGTEAGNQIGGQHMSQILQRLGDIAK